MSAEHPNEAAPATVVEAETLAPDVAAAGEDGALPIPRDEEVFAAIEALLFAAHHPITVAQMREYTGGLAEEQIVAAMAALRTRYEQRSCGLMILEVSGGFQLATKPAMADWVLAMHKHRRKNPITPALLETLAIVAYKQPVARSEIEAIRGVDCGGVLRALQDSDLIEVVGRKEVPGRPAIYGTSETFLKTFGLRTLDELPTAGMPSMLAEPPKQDEPPASPPAENPVPSDSVPPAES